MDKELIEIDILADALAAWESNQDLIDLEMLSERFEKRMLLTSHYELIKSIIREREKLQTPEEKILAAALWVERDPCDLFAPVKLSGVSESEGVPL